MGQVHVCAVAAREAGAGREGPCSWWDACAGGTAFSHGSPARPLLLCTRLDEARSGPRDLSSLPLAVTQLIAAKCSSNPSVGGSCASASKPFRFPAAASGLRANWNGVKGKKKKTQPTSVSGPFTVCFTSFEGGGAGVSSVQPRACCWLCLPQHLGGWKRPRLRSQHCLVAAGL